MRNTQPANSVQLAIDMLPGSAVSVGTTVSFRVTSKKYFEKQTEALRSPDDSNRLRRRSVPSHP